MKVKSRAVLFVITFYLFIALMASCGYNSGTNKSEAQENDKDNNISKPNHSSVENIEILEVENLALEESEHVNDLMKDMVYVENTTNKPIKKEDVEESAIGSKNVKPSTEYKSENILKNPEELKAEKAAKTEEKSKSQKYEYKNTDSNLISLGEFKLTAYCSCVQCCGKYAMNRPVDENGEEIVYGALGERLVAGLSIAVDPNVIPYYSKVVINGNTYIAHDTGGAIIDNRIDVYFDNHEDALNFGTRRAEVFVAT